MEKWVKQLRTGAEGSPTQGAPVTPEQHRICELEKQIKRIETENEIPKKATVDSIYQLNKSYPIKTLCDAFGTHRSSYKYWVERPNSIDAEHIHLLSEVRTVHTENNGSAGSRTICDLRVVIRDFDNYRRLLLMLQQIQLYPDQIRMALT